MDNPDLIALAVVGDGEAETGPLEGSWKGISFLNPERDGAVLPILHLNGAKIAGPTVLARKDPRGGARAARGPRLRGHRGRGRRPARHAPPLRRGARDRVRAASATIQADARAGEWDGARPSWPMIILRTPKGWTGPDVVDGVQMEGTWRAHQVPLSGVKDNPEHLAHPRGVAALVPARGAVRRRRRARPSSCCAPTPTGDLRMSAHAARQRRPAHRATSTCRTSATTPSTCRAPATVRAGVDPQARRADARHLPRQPDDSFRLFCPDETNCNRLGAVFEVSDRAFMERVVAERRDARRRDGRVMEVLSEHNCHGWLEGYTLTGRHGLFATYEAFAMVERVADRSSTASGCRRRRTCRGGPRCPASTSC